MRLHLFSFLSIIVEKNIARRRGDIRVKTALLLIAHGSRQEEANADLLHLAEELRRREQTIAEAAFLELAEPDIDEGGASCIRQGAEQVILVPYFLSAGVHVRRDLTAARTRLAERFPNAEFRLAEPLGRHPMLMNIVMERVRQSQINLTRSRING